MNSQQITVSAMIAAALWGASLHAQSERTEQQQIEIAAATYRYTPRHLGEVTGFAMDRFAYIIPSVSNNGIRNGIWPESEVAGVLDLSKDHDSSHVALLARLLGVEKVLDEKACAPAIPPACRVSGFPGILAFSPAKVRGDAAQILLYRFNRGERRDPNSGTVQTTVGYVVGFFFLVKEKGAWRVDQLLTLEAG